jgi:amidase
MAVTDPWRMGACELAAAIRTRQLSSREVVESHLRRISAVNPSVNAVVVVLGEEAIAAAADADRVVASGADLAPFHGVPFTVKENIDVFGTPTTQGARMLSAAYPLRDAPVVERLRAAGGIVIGRTNMPTFALRWHTESELWGATRNPWDRTRTPGASSAGEAVAVATGMSPLGLGSDGLGSLRHPAQCCGVAALKPSLGRVPTASSVEGPDSTPIGVQLTAVNGVLARRVADLREALSVLAGATWRDPWTLPAPLNEPRPREPVRVALVLDPGGRGTAALVQDGVRHAAVALEDAGYLVDEVEPPGIDAAADALLVMLSTPGMRAVWDQVLGPNLPEDARRFMSAFFAAAREPDAVTAEQAFVTRQALLRAWGEFQESHPLIVAPISTEMPSKAGTDLEDGQVMATITAMRMAMTVNALGLPAVAVPVGVSEGLPVAVQIIGRRFCESECLEAAQAVEMKRPPITPIDPR